jgi:iron-sulfur cluster assembly protein
MTRNLITISDAAADQIKYLLSIREKEAVGIKVKVKKGGCSGLSYQIEYADYIDKFDEVINDKDIKVIIEPSAVMYLIGTQMDYVKEKLKEGFVFINPNEKGKCGCGESFYV